MEAKHLQVGDWFSCDYNGKHRPLCQVVEIHPRWLVVGTENGLRRFKYEKVHKLCILSIV